MKGLKTLLAVGLGITLLASAAPATAQGAGDSAEQADPPQLELATGTDDAGETMADKPAEHEMLLHLSPGERQILELLAGGLRVKEIAERLELSPATVHTHVRNAIKKLEVDTRTEAVALAVRFSYLGALGGKV